MRNFKERASGWTSSYFLPFRQLLYFIFIHFVSVLYVYSKEIFKVQNMENILSCTHCTSTVDLFVSKNRIFFLDTPPLLSPSLMDKLIYQESKKLPFSSSAQTFSGGSQISCGDFSATENVLEITSLQTAAFILSVCHVVILVQDWFYDPNILR